MQKLKLFFAIALALIMMVTVTVVGFSGTASTPSGQPTETPSETPTANAPAADASTVYMTTDISPEGLMAIYVALGGEPAGNAAVKIHTGEPGGKNFLRPEFMKELVQTVDGTIVESNTAYGGQRASTAMHYQVAKDHGFTDIAPVVILDEEGSMALPVTGGTHLTENLVGARLADFDFLISLAHFKGHMIGGYGGALKNMSIGIASTAGKNRIHTAGNSDTQWMGGDQDDFLESMAEATMSVVDYFGEGNVLYINVMNRMSVDCDCSGAMAAEPEVHDIGILASFDPVALDQACIDLIYAVDDGTADSLIARIEGRNGTHVLEHGEAIGLGSRTYELLSIDSDAVTGSAPFNLENGTVMLNNGIEMPILGLGTYRLTAGETENSVSYALTHGYKLIDTAAAYGNEEAVGRGIKKSGVPREDVFIATKLWPQDYGNAAAAIDAALKKLDVEYIDLLLLHQPWGDNYIEAYQAMEVAVAEGKVRSIGLSNFYQNSFNAIMDIATIPPAVLQSERNPYFQQADMMEHIAPYGTVMMDWFPLGGRGDNIVPTERQQSLFENEVIVEIAKTYNKSAAQVILRWHLQSGGIAIPGSRNPDHILENITIFDFNLTDAEMLKIAALETDIPSFDFRETTEQPNFESFAPPEGGND